MKEDKLQDDFMEFWDSKKDSLGLGNYSDEITQFWFNILQSKLEEQRMHFIEEITKKYLPLMGNPEIISKLELYNQAISDVLASLQTNIKE